MEDSKHVTVRTTILNLCLLSLSNMAGSPSTLLRPLHNGKKPWYTVYQWLRFNWRFVTEDNDRAHSSKKDRPFHFTQLLTHSIYDPDYIHIFLVLLTLKAWAGPSLEHELMWEDRSANIAKAPQPLSRKTGSNATAPSHYERVASVWWSEMICATGTSDNKAIITMLSSDRLVRGEECIVWQVFCYWIFPLARQQKCDDHCSNAYKGTAFLQTTCWPLEFCREICNDQKSTFVCQWLVFKVSC